MTRLRARVAAWRGRAVLAPVLTLVGGTALAQAAVFAARPLLTRLYAPEAFGVLTLVTTVVSLLSAVAHGGYRYAVLLPEDDRDAGGLAGLALAGALVDDRCWPRSASAVAAAAGWTQGEAAWWLLPPALLALDASQTFETWLTRRDRFSVVSASRVGQSAPSCGPARRGRARVSGDAGSSPGRRPGSPSRSPSRRAPSGGPRAAARGGRSGRTRCATLARRYARFPAFSAPAAALNLAATRLPVLLLAAFAGEAVVGQFGVAYGTLALPLGLVTGAAGQVFFVRAAAAVARRHAARRSRATRCAACSP